MEVCLNYDIIILRESEEAMPEKITDGKTKTVYVGNVRDVGEYTGDMKVDAGIADEDYELQLVREDEENNYLEVTDNNGGNVELETVQNPHDVLFKQLFSDPEFFRDFLKISIGDDFANELVANSFAEEKTDFIGRDLQEYYSDIIYSARVGKTEYQFAFLIEHKSYPDRKVTFQILNYLQKMLERSWSKKKFIQPVLAFLVYHGEGSSKLIDFDAEYDHLPEEIRRDLFGVRIREVNITELDPNAISDNLLYISYLLVSVSRAKHKKAHIEFIFKRMNDIGDSKLQSFIENKLEPVIYYLFNMTDLPYEELKDIIGKYFSKGVDEMKTTADQLMEKGMEKGIKKGKI
ncbi:MAG: Rpn family recombination-promoting nuclease/putative transposase, partial [Halarsenatibacteraceae bacterium]